ncbi:hypothetical protein K490DRAFT_52709 [Saccharata proteae CBS 121410]|uniref:Alpha-galactosidase A n=1 Tax=Saccharata proteae CBS 121410 TaxID=1314787 RepID=A0A9P4HYE2_9PEZI|nr:hypothetical protein K490DRAFT_52709 [Saccharata proteae CBS 121410]
MTPERVEEEKPLTSALPVSVKSDDGKLATPIDFEILHTCIDIEDNNRTIRILTAKKEIKYLTVSHRIPNVHQAGLPPLPTGSWNYSQIKLSRNSNTPAFKKAKTLTFPSVTPLWHPDRIEYTSLHTAPTSSRTIKRGVELVTHPELNIPCIAKFAPMPWHTVLLTLETRNYHILHKHNINFPHDRPIGPAFLGHILEHGRAIGFLLEHVADARPATIADLDICREELGRLHALGYIHADVNRYNFLVARGSKKATLMDFASMRSAEGAEHYKNELEQLKMELGDEDSGKGKPDGDTVEWKYGAHL